MNRILKFLALSAFGLLLSGTGHAETLGTITSLTCYETSGGKVTIPVYAYLFDIDGGAPGYFAAYTNLSQFDPFAYDEILGYGFNYCQFANMKGATPSSITIVDVTAYGDGATVGAGSVGEDAIAQNYALITFAYKGLGVSSTVVKTGPLATPEEQKHSLEVFKTRIPPLRVK